MASVEIRPGLVRDSTQMSSETALHRTKPSTWARILIKRSFLNGSVFDWGCGRGRDLEYYREKGLKADGWDPIHRPKTPPSVFPQGSFNTVACTFVLNTLADPKERETLLQDVYNFLPAGGQLAIAVRSKYSIDSQVKAEWRQYGDGWITLINTFQRGYTKGELNEALLSVFPKVRIIPCHETAALASK